MKRALSIAGCVLLASSVSLAAPTAVGPMVAAPAPPTPAAARPQAAPAPAQTISGADMLEQGREYRGQIESVALQIQSQVQQAKGDKDVIRLNCLLDKLTQVKVNGNMMDQAMQALQDMLSRRDQGAALHEYTRITIINQKVQVLRTEADACVGGEANYVGPTKVFIEVPPGLQDNVDQPPPTQPPVTVVDRPPPGSPYQ